MRLAATAGPRRSRVVWAVGAALGAVLALAGCGVVANPEPPTLWLPMPVHDLTAKRVGDAVHLHWTMPKNTTDKVALKGDQPARFCWDFAPGFTAKTCHLVGEGKFAPEAKADFVAHLPAELTGSARRAVAFYVELESPAGKTAGPSNAAWVASGTAPAAVTGLRLQARAEGVALYWQAGAAEAGLAMRIHRELVKTAKTPKADEAKGVPPAAEQTLEVDLSRSDAGGAVDRDATLDRTWTYQVERVLRVKADGHTVEAAGEPSQTVTIDAKDVFPPAVPAGLVVVADAQGKTMDLSWTPDTEADIAGYIVYRRDVTAGGSMERITEKIVVPPSYSDADVVAGHRYAYAVSAVDLDGNESARSGEVEQEMPR